MSLKKILAAAGMAAGLSLIADTAEAEKKARTATVTIDQSAVKKSRSNRARPALQRVPACGIRQDLRDYKCLTAAQAERMGLDLSVGMPWSDYKSVNQSTGGRIGIFLGKTQYVGCPGPSGTDREKLCYNITKIKPKVVNVLGPERVVTKTVPGPERIVNVPGPERIVKVPVPASQPACSQRTPSACQDEKSCLAAKCNWYDQACHTEAKPAQPAEKGPQYNWNVGVFSHVYGGDGAQSANGVEAGRRIVKGLEAFVRAGHLYDSNNHAANNREVSSETELLPDNTTYKRTAETVDTAQADVRSRGFFGAGLKYGVDLGKRFSAAVSAGVDVRLGKKNTAQDYSQTNSLHRNDQPLRAPKTITNQVDSAEVTTGAYPYGGLEGCVKLGRFEVCGRGEAGYDAHNAAGNYGGGLLGRVKW